LKQIWSYYWQSCLTYL